MLRISAWVVTSSAVVGSSAISSLRSAGKGDGQQNPLAHAAGELMRIGDGADYGKLDEFEQFAHARRDGASQVVAARCSRRFAGRRA